MEFYSGNRENVLKKLGSSQKSGLTNEDAEKNKLKYGVNQFTQEKEYKLEKAAAQINYRSMHLDFYNSKCIFL